MLKGSCLCGDITYEVSERPGDGAAGACHCSQCRKQSGHFWAAATVPIEAISIAGEPAWYQATPKARRGFCPRCGSFLFWQGVGADHVDFALGSIDGPTGLHLSGHIFVADKGDYYDIGDGLPCHAAGLDGEG